MSSIRVLLADDHAIVLDGLRRLLEDKPDITVIADAADGREAVRLAKKLEPDVAILDIAMPALNGIEAAAQIHALRPKIRVIILSMYSTREHIYRALKAGAWGYLLKESAAQEVLKAVREVTAGRRYLSEKVSSEVLDAFLEGSDHAPIESPLERLSAREREILQLVAEGRSSSEIGKLLFLSPKTVDTYRSRLMRKLGVGDLAALVRFAIEHGVVASS